MTNFDANAGKGVKLVWIPIWRPSFAHGPQSWAQETEPTDSLYSILDPVTIPTRSGVDISAIVVRKRENTAPLPVILFHTTYDQGPGDAILGKRSADRDYVGVVSYSRGIPLAFFEVMGDGTYFYLSRYVGRASYARDPSKRQLLRPGKQEVIPFDNTRFVSKKLNKGSRLLILLNINKNPFEIINYGSGNPVVQETIRDASEPLQIKWHNTSAIKVPVWME